MPHRPIRIPKDPEKRAALARMAGLTEEEALAIDQWCASQAREDERRRRRGWEQHADKPMGRR